MTQTFTSGPLTMQGYETRDVDVAMDSPQVNGYLTDMHAYVVDAQGKAVPQTRVMLHHAVFINHGRFTGDKRALYCNDRPREPFYGTAEEDSALHLPAGYGYPVRKGDRWRAQFMLMNHRAPTRRVFLRYVVTTDTAPHTAVTPYWVSVACQRQRVYNVPGGGAPGSQNVRSTEWAAPKAGRIVALVGHLHGGGERLDLVDPACGNRTLTSAVARYGAADDPIYAMSPMLHEPSPRSVSLSMSSTGWPLRAGQRLRIDSVYDNSRPHVKVMGIAHIYVAEGGAPSDLPCPPAPAQVSEVREVYPGAPGRAEPPVVQQDLSRRDARGVARAIPGISGPVVREAGDTDIAVRGFAFWPRRISVPVGATVNWRFMDRAHHDVSWVRGPRGFASRYLRRGNSYRTQLTVPGHYEFFCSLHPVDMNQTIDVRGLPGR